MIMLYERLIMKLKPVTHPPWYISGSMPGNSCNTDMADLPDMYAQSPKAVVSHNLQTPIIFMHREVYSNQL